MCIYEEVGHYNVSINDGNLNEEDDKWYYQLQIDKFDNNEEWIDSKNYYIKGHTDKDEQDKAIKHHLLHSWIDHLTEQDVDTIYLFKRNHRFEIVPPTLVSLV